MKSPADKAPESTELSHVDRDGQARMVDVSGKQPSLRRARAEGLVRMRRETSELIAIWEGAKLYAVFQGALVTDTVKVDSASADSAKAGPRTRFHLVEVKSMRTWERGDCNGMRIPGTAP